MVAYVCGVGFPLFTRQSKHVFLYASIMTDNTSSDGETRPRLGMLLVRLPGTSTDAITLGFQAMGSRDQSEIEYGSGVRCVEVR